MNFISFLPLQRLFALSQQPYRCLIAALVILNCVPYAMAGESSEKNIVPTTLQASPVDNRFVLTGWSIGNSHTQELYMVERSSDGIHYETAGYVRGEFSQAPEIQYSFIDENPFNGNSYYRVKIIYSDKQVSYTAPVSVRIDKLQFKLFPNPASRNENMNLTIQDTKTQQVVLQLFDLTGARLLNKVMPVNEGQNALQFSLEGISSGTYTLTVSSDSYFEKQSLVVQ